MMNLDIYTVEMRKSIWDKAFFMDKIIGAKCIVDYGCADAQMICYLARLFPEIEFHGYDINIALIDRAVDWILFYELPNVHVWSPKRLPNMIKQISNKFKPDEICLNFSSVLHEVFSSTGGTDVIQTLIKELNPKYITIRDMYYHHEVLDEEDEYLSELQKVYIINGISNVAPGCYNKFVAKFGTIKKMKDLVHFLMKSQWHNNGYDQELEENYFSWRIKDVRKLVKNYKVIYETHYMLPYYVEQWEKYGIEPDVHTHAQFILRRDK